jgi:hypothetical protein
VTFATDERALGRMGLGDRHTVHTVHRGSSGSSGTSEGQEGHARQKSGGSLRLLAPSGWGLALTRSKSDGGKAHKHELTIALPSLRQLANTLGHLTTALNLQQRLDALVRVAATLRPPSLSVGGSVSKHQALGTRHGG